MTKNIIIFSLIFLMGCAGKEEYIKKLTILNQKLDEMLNINGRISCKPNPNYKKNINDITKLLSNKFQCMEKRIEELNKINFV